MTGRPRNEKIALPAAGRGIQLALPSPPLYGDRAVRASKILWVLRRPATVLQPSNIDTWMDRS